MGLIAEGEVSLAPDKIAGALEHAEKMGVNVHIKTK